MPCLLCSSEMASLAVEGSEESILTTTSLELEAGVRDVRLDALDGLRTAAIC
jgi:hypothetical protein